MFFKNYGKLCRDWSGSGLVGETAANPWYLEGELPKGPKVVHYCIS